MYKIYCDLDGVLVAWEKRVVDLFGSPFTSFSRNRLFKLIDQHSKDFWYNMEWEEGGKQLWDYIKPYSPTILTAPSNDLYCKPGKKHWVQKNLGKSIPIIFEHDKSIYAAPNHILIDDREDKNIEPWREKGGIGILHKDTEETINQLEEILGMPVKGGVMSLKNLAVGETMVVSSINAFEIGRINKFLSPMRIEKDLGDQEDKIWFKGTSIHSYDKKIGKIVKQKLHFLSPKRIKPKETLDLVNYLKAEAERRGYKLEEKQSLR